VHFCQTSGAEFLYFRKNAASHGDGDGAAVITSCEEIYPQTSPKTECFAGTGASVTQSRCGFEKVYLTVTAKNTGFYDKNGVFYFAS
jgi:hypothetical protein